MLRVFISHSSLDREFIEREIIPPLRAHGVETWYSTDNIKTAAEWERQIREALKACDWFLVALSPRSVASVWVQREVHWAFLKRKEYIVPVMLETCEPDDLHLGLLPLQYIDFRHDVARAQERLLSVWALDKSAQVKTQYHAAQEALTKDDWATAVEHLEAVLRLDPAHSLALTELKHARQRQELAALYEVGSTHVREKRWHKALETLEQVQVLDSDYKDIAELLALVGSELDKEEAERLYREAYEAMSQGNWTTAVGQLQAALKLNPAHADVQAALSRAQRQRELAQLYETGHAHLQSKRWREALKIFRRMRAIDKSYRGVAELIAEADAGLEAGEEQRRERESSARAAKEESERQEQLVREEVAWQSRAEATSQRKSEAEGAQKKGTAEPVHNAKNPLRPPKYTTAVSLVLLSVGLGLLLALTDAPDPVYKGKALSIQKNHAEAEAEFRKAVESEPNNASYHYGLGNTLNSLKRYKEAEVEYRKAIELNPNNANLHVDLAVTLHNQNRHEEGAAEKRKALQIDPSNKTAKENLRSR